jgi:anti-sigma B factor antagonist
LLLKLAFYSKIVLYLLKSKNTMSIQIENNDKYSVIKITAEKLDSNLAPSLKSELVVLNTDGVKNIIIDMTDARYCDSSGLSAILVANRLCKNSNGHFVLSGLQDTVRKLIVISQLDTILTITETVAEAKDKLSVLA